MERLLNFINGKFEEPAKGEFLANSDPATGKKIGDIANSSSEDANAAIQAAAKAFPLWSQTPWSVREKIIRKLADLIEENLEEFALWESTDNGKPISLARAVDIPRASTNLSFFCSAFTSFKTEAFQSEGHSINMTMRDPLGVIACISPWNLPLYLFTWKIAPALVAGNTVVAKPSEVTPLTATKLCELAVKAGLPAGVLNVIHGEGPRVGETLVSHPEVKAVTFTGSTAVGKYLASSCAVEMKKVSLEMGGKNPTLILNDAHLPKAIPTAAKAAFANQGQICLCGSRILIQEEIYEQVKIGLIEWANKRKLGDPKEKTTEHGAMVGKAHFEKVMSFIEKAKSSGAKILCGGESYNPDGLEGYFIQPTLIEGLGCDHALNQEEIFGPVATLQKFKTLEEGIELANDSQYGLAASIWTENIGQAKRCAREIKAGMVWINTWMERDLRTIFGGIKESGYGGKEGGEEALRFVTEARNICFGESHE